MAFEAIKITEKVWWVGAVDWALKEFHGYTTHRGTTYNAYLVLADTPVLIDTVKAPFKDEMYARIESVIGDVHKIKTIVSNHAEPDHSGALPQVIRDLNPEKVYASVNGVRILDAQFQIGSRLAPVKNGDSINLGGMFMTFVETKMLHWPDSMFSYIPEEKILFSQDAFGMHLATDKLFVDENDWNVVREEMRRYYANILLLYSPQVLKLIDAFPSLHLDVRITATDHGPIWRGENALKPVGMYAEWAARKPEPRAVVVYDTMWLGTEKMARSIADGVRSAGMPVNVFNMHAHSRSDVATFVMNAGLLFAGSPTINNNMYPTMADVLCYLKGLRPANLTAAAFGSFGWGGEAPAQISELLKSMGATIAEEPLKLKFASAPDDLKKAFEYGKRIAQNWLETAQK